MEQQVQAQEGSSRWFRVHWAPARSPLRLKAAAAPRHCTQMQLPQCRQRSEESTSTMHSKELGRSLRPLSQREQRQRSAQSCIGHRVVGRVQARPPPGRNKMRRALAARQAARKDRQQRLRLSLCRGPIWLTDLASEGGSC